MSVRKRRLVFEINSDRDVCNGCDRLFVFGPLVRCWLLDEEFDVPFDDVCKGDYVVPRPSSCRDAEVGED